MKQKTNRTKTEETTNTQKPSVYNDDDFENFDKKPETSESLEESKKEQPIRVEKPKKSYKEPDKMFRRNITLSEEQFRKLEFIKKTKNKAREKDEELVTLDKLMFDMIQHCLDTQYPEASVMFEKYIKLKEMEDFADLM